MADLNVRVLIVGAGPTGLLLANLLGRMGVSACLIEQNETTVDAPRAVSIDDESMRALQAVDLDKAVGAVTQKGYGSLYKGPNGKVFATVKPRSREYGFDKRNAFQQPELEAIMRDGLDRYDSVLVRFSTRLSSFTQDSDGVTAVAETPDSNSLTIRADYLVACDGGRSPTRKMLGIKMTGSSFDEPWLIVDLASTKNPNFHTEIFCDPDRPCITLPGPSGIRRYEFKLKAAETREEMESEPAVRQLLARFGPDADEKILRILVYHFHARTADQWRDGRIFLAGDAAHLTPPFAGQGLNSGLRDAHNLAWKLDDVISGTADPALLETYETERRPHAEAMIRLAIRLGAIMMPESKIQGAAVRGAFHALGVYPPARDYIANMRFKPKPRFESGLIWRERAKRQRTIVGSLFPQPLVENAAGASRLLDNDLPDQPVLIIYANRPESALSPALLQEFETLGVSVFGITPEGMKPQPAAFTILRDANCQLAGSPYSAYLDHGLLIRRDRYIAAIAPIPELPSLLRPARHLGGLASPQNRNDDDSFNATGPSFSGRQTAALP